MRNKSTVRAHYGARSLSEAPKENAHKCKIKAYLPSILPVCSFGEKNSLILWFFPLLLLICDELVKRPDMRAQREKRRDASRHTRRSDADQLRMRGTGAFLFSA